MVVMHNKLIHCLILLLLMGVLSSCSSVKTYQTQSDYQQKDLFYDEVMGKTPALLSQAQVFDLTEAQKREINDIFRSSAYRKLSPSRKIFKFLQTHLQNFNFHSDTLIATDALDLNSGNCLSLAILR